MPWGGVYAIKDNRSFAHHRFEMGCHGLGRGYRVVIFWMTGGQRIFAEGGKLVPHFFRVITQEYDRAPGCNSSSQIEIG